MSDDTRGQDPIDREAERARVQGSDVTADPTAHGSQGSLIGATEQATVDHKIRRSPNEPTEDIAAQRRDVVNFTHADHQPPAASGMGEKGELERLAGNSGGQHDLMSDHERVTDGQNDGNFADQTDLLSRGERTVKGAAGERYAQNTDGATGREDEAGGHTNSGDKAAPYNQD